MTVQMRDFKMQKKIFFLNLPPTDPFLGSYWKAKTRSLETGKQVEEKWGKGPAWR